MEEEWKKNIKDVIERTTACEAEGMSKYELVEWIMEEELGEAREEAEEIGYRMGCIDTCETYFEKDKKHREDFMKYWYEKQKKLLEMLEDFIKKELFKLKTKEDKK